MTPAWLALIRHSEVRTGMSTEKMRLVWCARNWPRQSATNPAVQAALRTGGGLDHPAWDACIVNRLMVTVEVCRRVAQEVEVGVGHAHPNHAPHPLPELCDDLQQFQLREAEIGHRAEVGPQQRLVLGVGEGMVYREVSEIEIDVAHR